MVAVVILEDVCACMRFVVIAQMPFWPLIETRAALQMERTQSAYNKLCRGSLTLVDMKHYE